MAPQSQSQSRRTRLTSSLILPLLLLSSSTPSSAAQRGDEPPPLVAPPFILPPVHYSVPHSFRGVQPGGRIPNFGISGHASGLPGVHDYLRLVPPTPLAFGGIFTSTPLTSEEWVAEIAFRVHGPTAGVLVETTPGSDEKPRRIPKGGRGLAFWFSKDPNPTPVTLSADQAVVTHPAPASVPDSPTDHHDPLVSLFGYKTSFDGLGVIFDTSPTTPVHPRSDERNWSEELPGVAASGVVSGLLDDGTGSGKWLEGRRVLKEGEEAGYLDKALGECEAAFRNAQGLLWARISYIDSTIRVDLDLQPHTTLAKAGRDYAHNCFSLSGIKLTTGAYLGLTGLASGCAEPDAVDVYAMDVFEVVKVAEGQRAPKTDEPVDIPESEATPLEGTNDDASVSLAHEIFLSQARMLEAIDALSRRVEGLSRTVTTSMRGMNTGAAGGGGGPGGPPGGIPNPLMLARLTTIESKLSEILAAPKSPIPPPMLNYDQNQQSEKDSVKHILQLQDRLMVELKAFGRKVDSTSGQTTASLSTISSRSSEILTLATRLSTSFEEHAAEGPSWSTYVIMVLLFLGVVGVWRRDRGDGLGGGGLGFKWGGGRNKRFE